MRTYGLSGSGMDIDQMVKDLMKAKRASYDKITQQKTQVEWRKKDYNAIYTLVQDFRTKTLADFKKQSNLSPKLVSSSNDAVVSATATGEAANIDHSIVISQLADGVKISSSGNVTPSGNAKTSLTAQFGLAVGSSFDFTINGKKITVNVTDSTTLNDVVNSINQADAGVKANYDATLDRFFLYSEKTGSAAAVGFAGSSSSGADFLFNKLKLGSFSSELSTVGLLSRNTVSAADFGTKAISELYGISSPFQLGIAKNGVADTIDIAQTDTMNDVLTKINAKLGAGAATYDAATGRIAIKPVDSNSYTLDGKDAAGKSFLADNLGLVQLAQNGHDAKVKLDGVDLQPASNSFTISGVNYTLKTTGLVNPSTGELMPTTIGVKPDVKKTIDAVKSFVDSYNALMATVNKELKEDRYLDYLPLTAEQKNAMKESEITAWESRAKSGLLRNDSILSSLVVNLRQSFSDPIQGLTGDYTSASSIGIATGSYVDANGKITAESGNRGKLYVNEDQLRKALEKDPDVVYKIFGTTGNAMESNGVANRLTDRLYSAMNELRTKAGYPDSVDISSMLAKQLTDYNTRINAMDKKLKAIETRYYNQFNAMEAAVSRMNKQSAWLAQQFSSGR